jgi:hypothetical protein
MSHFILSELNKPLFVFFGLAAWAVAYVYLTYVITPDSIGELMTLIVAALPVLTGIVALIVTFVSFEGKQQHTVQGIIFAIVTIVAFGVAIFRYVDSKDQRSEIRGVLKENVTRRHPLRSTIAIILWGLLGAIFVFASELGLIFGGWQFLQGSKLLGASCAVPGAVIVALSIRGSADTWNPIRRAVIALQGDDKDRSVTFFRRLLEPARLKDQALQY